MALIVVIIAVILSESRAGIISILSVLLVVGYRYIYLDIAKKRVLIMTIIVGLVIGLYFLKQDSADGRLLIWQCSLEMIKEKPFFGFGSGGFIANYMNYQADYFNRHPNSSLNMLADNVNHPFNEYILLLVNYGISGLIIFIIFILYLLKAYRKHSKNSILKAISFWCLISVGIFSLFSYPLKYPFVWVMGLFSINILVLSERFIPGIIKIVRMLIIPTSLVFIYITYNHMYREIKWCSIANNSLYGQTKEMLSEYEKLYNKLSHNRLFLYNYAAELNFAGNYKKSLSIALNCEKIWADYDLQMVIADNYLELGETSEAEKYFIKSSHMCPVKYLPLYKLYLLYKKEGDENKSFELANKILIKPIKIMSQTVINIKSEIEKDLLERGEQGISIEKY